MTESQKWRLLVLLLLTSLLLYLLAPVLAPFATAAILAYIGNPLITSLARWRLSRTLAVSVIFLLFTLLLVLLVLVGVPLLERQWATLLSKLPVLFDWLQQQAIPWLQQHFGLDETVDLGMLKANLLEQWSSLQGLASKILSSVSRSGLAMVGWLVNLLLIPVVTFYLLRDWPRLVNWLHELLPRHIEPEVVKLVRAVDEVLGHFFRGQLLVMLALAFSYALGLWLVGLDLALLIGLLAGLVSFVPYLGLIVGLLAASIAALIQFHEFTPLLYVLLVFGVAQSLESMLLTPLLLGERIGLHPVAVIFAVLAGGQLFGFLGVLLALPVAAILLVLLRYAHQHYLKSRFYSAANQG
ncbi:MAG: AI-2E family transporter [Thiohalomonadaceae bacterium]